jgi:hypothetical protein
MTGILSRIFEISELGAQVTMQKLSTTSPVAGSVHGRQIRDEAERAVVGHRDA